MKRKLITFIGLVSPLLLLLICVSTLLVGLTGWWFFGQKSNARLVRIMQLAPLITPQTGQSQSNQTKPVELSGVETTEQANKPTNITDPGTPEEVEEALGFALPEGAVNSISQTGLANRLIIPKLQLDAPVALAPIENKSWRVDQLGQAVGHLEGTAALGSHGNVVLAAHVTLRAGVYGPFAGLGQLTSGDTLTVYDDNGQAYQYVVDGLQLVDQTAVEVTYPSNVGKITLITCSNWDRHQQRYVERLIVTGHLIEG